MNESMNANYRQRTCATTLIEIAQAKSWFAMKRPVQHKLLVNLVASQTRRRLKGFGHGIRRVATDGKNRAVIFHTATGQHLRELEALFADVLPVEIDVISGDSTDRDATD